MRKLEPLISNFISHRVLNAEKQREYKDASSYLELAAMSEKNIEIYEKVICKNLNKIISTILQLQLPQLRKKLEDLRLGKAMEMECPANSVYSNTVIDGFLKHRPTK